MTNGNACDAGKTPETHLVWQSSVFCICCTDSRGNLIRFTPAFVKLVSGAGMNKVPVWLADLIHPEDRPDFMKNLLHVCSEDALMEKRPVRMVMPDGRIKLMEVSGEAVSNPAGEKNALMFWEESLDDSRVIQWLPQETMDLVRFQEIMASFITSLFDPVVLINTEGRIVNFNAPVQDMLGYRRNELIGSPVAVLFESRKDQVPKAMARFARVMRSGRIRDFATAWITRDGGKVPITISSSMIRSASGELMGIIMVARDERSNALLADLEKKNRELEKTYQALKKLDLMKDDLLSLVGHELRAPLANILGYAEFLKDWELAEDEKAEYVGIIYQESHRLRRLVDDILDLSRMEAGRINYNYIIDSVNRVVNSAVEPLRVEAEKKGVRILLKLDDQLEPIEFDPDRIQQVVTNILHNAIKFTDSGKVIRVITDAVEDGQRVTIADQGIGIPRDFAAKVFDRFEQATSVKHHSEGAGLGMSIARLIVVEGHRGKIWFDSEGEGRGSVFRFILPERRLE